MFYSQVLGRVGDAGSVEDINQLLEDAISRFGKIDHLVRINIIWGAWFMPLKGRQFTYAVYSMGVFTLCNRGLWIKGGKIMVIF